MQGSHSHAGTAGKETHLALQDELAHGADVVLRWGVRHILLVGRGDQRVCYGGHHIVASRLRRHRRLHLHSVSEHTKLEWNAQKGCEQMTL